MVPERSRARNFTREDRLLLCELVMQFKEVLNCKKLDATTWRRKAQAWEDLAELFNERSGYHRTALGLRTCWEAMKKRCRKRKKLGEEKETDKTQVVTNETNIINILDGITETGNGVEVDQFNSELQFIIQEETNDKSWFKPKENGAYKITDESQSHGQQSFFNRLKTKMTVPDLDSCSNPENEYRKNEKELLTEARLELINITKKQLEEEGEMKREIFTFRKETEAEKLAITCLQRKQEEIKLQILQLELQEKKLKNV